MPVDEVWSAPMNEGECEEDCDQLIEEIVESPDTVRVLHIIS